MCTCNARCPSTCSCSCHGARDVSREWAPGDVALVKCSDGEWRQATCEPHPGAAARLVWRFPDRLCRRFEDSDARPLVVIDPEDREQVERLLEMSWAAARAGAIDSVSATQDALREFASRRRCPAALDIKGEHFSCDLAPSHGGLAHSSRAAEAIWTDDPEVLSAAWASAEEAGR